MWHNQELLILGLAVLRLLLPMISIAELSALLTTLYAAPLEPGKWRIFLDRLCSLTNTASGYMVSIRPTEGNVLLGGGGLNFNPEILRLYNEHYGACDPYVKPVTLEPRIGIIPGEELVPHSELLQSELYNDLLRQYDLEHMTLVSSSLFAGEGDFFPLWRSPQHGPMDQASIHLLEILLPHIQTALRLRTKVIGCNLSELFSESTLEVMSIAAFLVNDRGLIRYMNQRAVSYLKGGEVLLLREGRLTISEPINASRLESLISAAAFSGRKEPVGAPGGAIKVSRDGTKGSLYITVVPVPRDNQFGDQGSSALVFIHDSSASRGSRASLMSQMYGLTPTEARVADLLLEGLEVRDVAERVGITLETCRFHIKRVLAKTDTHRQTQLLRLMLSLPGS